MCISLFRLVVTRMGTLYGRGGIKRFKIGKRKHATKKVEKHCVRPSDVYSDNGGNFVASERELKKGAKNLRSKSVYKALLRENVN